MKIELFRKREEADKDPFEDPSVRKIVNGFRKKVQGGEKETDNKPFLNGELKRDLEREMRDHSAKSLNQALRSSDGQKDPAKTKGCVIRTVLLTAAYQLIKEARSMSPNDQSVSSELLNSSSFFINTAADYANVSTDLGQSLLGMANDSTNSLSTIKEVFREFAANPASMQ